MLSLLAALLQMQPAPEIPSEQVGSAEILEAARTDDRNWRALSPANTLYMQVNGGRVVIELNPALAPENAAALRALATAGVFDGGTIDRVQENYVVQWSAREDADAEAEGDDAPVTVPGELARDAADMTVTAVPYADSYAPRIGFVNGFPVAMDDSAIWQTHCYGALGVGRGDDVDGADGRELYVVIGHAPRHLDRNITLAGRVVDGMEYLTVLQRGTGPLGFYETDTEKTGITSIRLASDVAEAERPGVEIMRTDTPAFSAWVDARANRARDGWFVRSAGAIDLCNIPVPTREVSEEE
ncbi:MAG: peptidylprolyl isomerase [Pseudomonadota bacterium]